MSDVSRDSRKKELQAHLTCNHASALELFLGGNPSILPARLHDDHTSPEQSTPLESTHFMVGQAAPSITPLNVCVISLYIDFSHISRPGPSLSSCYWDNGQLSAANPRGLHYDALPPHVPAPPVRCQLRSLCPPEGAPLAKLSGIQRFRNETTRLCI